MNMNSVVLSPQSDSIFDFEASRMQAQSNTSLKSKLNSNKSVEYLCITNQPTVVASKALNTLKPY